MTMTQAVQSVVNGVRPGARGLGCAAIVMSDGRRYNVSPRYYGADTYFVERYTEGGDLVERVEPSEIVGEAEHVEWTCDELGGIYIS